MLVPWPERPGNGARDERRLHRNGGDAIGGGADGFRIDQRISTVRVMAGISPGRIGRSFGLPDNFDHSPLLAVEDRLNAVDAAVQNFAFGRLAFGGGAGLVGAPKVGDVRPGFGADLDLVLVKDVACRACLRRRSSRLR